MSQSLVNFIVQYEEKPEQSISITMYAFDEKGEFITCAPVKGNQVQLKLTDTQAKKARIILAPSPPENFVDDKPNFEKIQRRQAYNPPWGFDPKTRKYELSPIPKILMKYWLWCKCLVRGKVVKRVTMGATTEEWPVYLARVHICEVDPVWLILRRIPEREIFRIRDELIKEIGKPIPSPFEPLLSFDSGVIDHSPENVARMKMEMPYRLKAPLLKVTPQLLSTAKKLSIPAKTKVALSSASAETVKQALADNIDLIRPYLRLWPWIWPFFLHCDEIAVVLTDKQGQFSANTWYLCAGDHPDIYFWVEYQIGSAWTTVYRPPIMCYTYWNYACGTEVMIPISDPRVPWYSEPSPIPGKQVAILTIGHDVSIAEIQRVTAGTNEGLTTAGEPFGGSLEPTVWFGDGIAASGITHYRWSYRRLTDSKGNLVADVWHALDYRVIRHYGEILADGTLVFKPFPIGPDPVVPGAALFKLQPKNPPLSPGAISAAWAPQVDARENTANAFFLSHLLEGGNPEEAAGKCELKLELLRYNSTTHAITKVNLTDEGVLLKIPTTEAPFGSGTVPTRVVPHDLAIAPDMEDRVIREGSANKIVAFRLVLHIDNNPCQADIYPIKVTGAAPGTWETVGTCGFIRYSPTTPVSPPAQALISFKAAHPNNFARFVFTMVKGSTGYVNSACAPVNPTVAWTSLPLVKDNPVNGFIRDATSVYSKQMPIPNLVGTCPDGTAAFGENLSVYPLATDGWSTLWYLSRYGLPIAFALQPKPKI
jgi:hypothetical protein